MNSSNSNHPERSSIAAHLVVPILIKPILHKLERESSDCAHAIRCSLIKAENSSPGILLELLIAMIKKADLSVNIIESLLRLQGTIPEFDDYIIRRREEPFQEMNKKSVVLRKILSRIPDEINDRPIFLATIKEIASAIKKIMDCVNAISDYTFDLSDKQVLDIRKREFIKYSKRFSTTLKEFFKEGESTSVYISAAHLIHQTNLLHITVKDKCDNHHK
ncbi:programmed cell death protein 10-like [Panonychus citri]|uniref:programmed cell death protein 10-like n=1 Tax=Panonychus citri TaxID=50023 RepID=UPI002307893A|nr:programmed cell death protein 10-like [Panonychus citri]